MRLSNQKLIYTRNRHSNLLPARHLVMTTKLTVFRLYLKAWDNWGSSC